MLAISFETAKTVAAIAAVAFVALAIASAWLVRNLVGKIITIVVLAALAFACWSQRTNLVECADRAKEQLATGQTDITCQFFGQDVTFGD